MLYNIINPKSFKACIESVKKAYWPYEKLLKDYEDSDDILDYINRKLNKKPSSDEECKIKNDIDEIVKKIIEKVSAEVLYVKIDANGEEKNFIQFPFIKKFHELFLEREFNIPYSEYENFGYSKKDIFRLHKNKDKKAPRPQNYSKNSGNYNHFVNVVGALAHLVHFFSKENDEAINILSEYSFVKENEKDEFKEIFFDGEPNLRTLKLMLAGFFHDIGKTVVDHRHAMEGYIILSSYKSKDLSQFSELYKGQEPDLDRDDLLFIADLTNHHDLFGTLSNGENGYMKLVELIERIERSVRRRKQGKKNDEEIKHEEIDEIMKGGSEFLFDLWLLNVADIIVSREDKNDEKEWQKENPGSLDEEIKDFFKGNEESKNNIKQGRDLLHDLKIAFMLFNTHVNEIFDTYVKEQCFKNAISIKEAANKCSYDHTIGRIRRIVKSSLFTEIDEQRENIEKEIDKKNLLAEDKNDVKEHLEYFCNKLKDTNIYQLDGIIETSIKCSTNFPEFLDLLSWIGQLDYSLGFFKRIAKHALYKTGEQIISAYLKYKKIDPALIGDVEHTGWINDKYEKFIESSGKICEDLNEINSKYFLDNYVSLIVKILNYLLCRKELHKEKINIEFEDATRRLTNDKINEILFFEGLARASKSTMSVLKTVFIY